MKKLKFTHRAINDLKKIKAFSEREWGTTITEQYFLDLEAAFSRIAQYPEILRPFFTENNSFVFYSIREHLVICDVSKKDICILTILHTSQNVIELIDELAPELRWEIKSLRHQF